MEWSEHEDFLYTLYEKGIEPKALDVKPEIDSLLVPYVRAFSVLSSRRQAGMDVQNIQLSEIMAYLGVMPFDDVPLYVSLMIDMDRQYMASRKG